MYLDKELRELIATLKKKKISISIAESCSGGLISQNLIKFSGASEYFNMGLITYSNYSKNKILKVKLKTLNLYGAVSEQTCKEMANNLLKISRSDIAISTTGIAGPDGGSKQKPVGLVFIGVSTKNKIEIK
jgi:PncC family amidohydrolase